MTRMFATLFGSAALGIVLCAPVQAQGTPQTLALTKVDETTLATGYRASKVIGSAVVNEAGEAVGTISDLIVTPADKVPFVVLSVGGFLGVGMKYVAVPAGSLEVRDKKMVLVGTTKDSLKTLPSFSYAD